MIFIFSRHVSRYLLGYGSRGAHCYEHHCKKTGHLNRSMLTPLLLTPFMMAGCSIQYADPYYGYHDEDKTFRTEGFIATMNQGGPFVKHPKRPKRWDDFPAYETTRCTSQPPVSTKALQKLKRTINDTLPYLQSQWRDGDNRLLRLEIPQKSIFFVDAPHLRPDAYATLDSLSDIINKTQLKVDFIGHADSTGTQAYNQTLSARRALHLQRYFVLKGLPVSRSESYGLGESTPIASNTNTAGRKKNRRVSLVFCTLSS